MTLSYHRSTAVLVILASALALLAALASERYGGLVPCALCLVERWPYRIAVVLGVVTLLLPQRWGRLTLALAALVLLADAAIAVVHLGVENKLWPSPLPQCQAPRLSGSIAERLAQMPLRPSKPCEDPTYLVDWLPISLAGMNFIYSLACGLGLSAWLLRTRRRQA